MLEPITIQQLIDAGEDARDLSDVVNGAADLNGTGLVPTRTGGNKKTLSKLEAEYQTIIDAQQVQEEQASTSAAQAAQSAVYAGGFETPEYASQAAGEAATSTGEVFRVPLGTSPQTFNWYRRTASGSELVEPLATSTTVSRAILLSDQSLTLEQFASPGFSYYNNPGDRGTDWHPALMAALDAINRYAPINSRWSRVPRIELPLGAMFFGQKVEQKIAAHLRGHGSGVDDFNGGTRFIFPPATQGWAVNSSNTIDGGIESPTTDALGTILEGIQFESEGGGNGYDTSQELNYAGVAIAAATNTYGLWVRSTSIVRNCSAVGWKGNGAQIIAVAGGTGGLRGNANGTVFDTFTVREDNAGTPSQGHGFFVCGNDANACTFKDIRVRHSGLMGILEIGTLGNLWLNPRTDDWGRVAITGVTALKRACWHSGIRYILIDIAVGIGAATTPGTNANVWYPFETAASADALFPAWSPSDTYVAMLPMSFHGQSNVSQVKMPYIETGYPGHAAGSSSEPGTGVIIYGGSSVWTPRTRRLRGSTASGNDAVVNSTGFGSFNQPRPGTTDLADFGSYTASSIGARPGLIWSGRTQRDGESDYALRFTPSGEIVMDRGGFQGIMRISTPLTNRQFGTGSNVPLVASFNNFALADPSDSNNDRRLRMGLSAPSSGGPYARGERVWNTNPGPGRPDYWECITTGSPGTWIGRNVIPFQSGVASSALTGTTAETVLATLSLPGGTLGPNGVITVDAIVSAVGTAGTKAVRARLGGATGMVFGISSGTATAIGGRLTGYAQNRNNVASQIGAGDNQAFTFATGALVTGSIDTASTQDIVITGQLGAAGDSLTLEGYSIRIEPGS